MREPFERWVRDHHAAVWRSAWRVVRNAADASDVTQEVFAQAWRRAAEVARTDSPAAYLRWLAVKTALAQLRGSHHRRHREEEHAMQRPERIEPQPPEVRELERAVQQSSRRCPTSCDSRPCCDSRKGSRSRSSANASASRSRPRSTA
ncbi:MAG: sigma-70 family RNA polymerase sigma factor [Planctomycetes bacterium]|nr:sigma-70 family RNA polymerase sigma factor [Planctomycetota bacterium]